MHHAIILGCGRSGTSIFGELFMHLPPYKYYSEPAFDDLITFDYSTPTAIKVPTESIQFPSDNGLSFPLDKLLEVIPEPFQIFWQIRHPLDTICSLKVGISRNWGHHPRPDDWLNWLEKPLVQRCAHHWNFINSFGYDRVAHLAKIKTFESLINDPFNFAQTICNDLQIDVHLQSSYIKEWSQRVQNSNNKYFVEAETSKPYSTNDHSVRIGRWKENLTSEEVGLVLPIIDKTSNQLGFPSYDFKR